MPDKELEIGLNESGEVVVNFEPSAPSAFHAVFTAKEARAFANKLHKFADEATHACQHRRFAGGHCLDCGKRV